MIGWIFLPAIPLEAIDDFLLGPGTSAGLDNLFSEIITEGQVFDYDGLRDSHLSPISGWHHVRPARPNAQQAADPSYRWRAEAHGVTPLGTEPIVTLIEIPAGGEYRISLRHQISLRAARPVTLTLQPQRAVTEPDGNADAVAEAATPVTVTYVADGEPLYHEFGNVRLRASTAAGQQETLFPVRFESEFQRVGFPTDPMIVWEHWDVTLPAGIYEMALATPQRDVRVYAVFLSRSKDFRPSLASIDDDNTLSRLYARFRLIDPQPADRTFTIQANLTYHWRGRRPPEGGEDIWYWNAGSVSAVKPNEWSTFLDVTDAVIPGPGPWSTWRVRAGGLERGRLAVQFAWSPHEAAAMLDMETLIAGDGSMFRFPNRAAPVGAGGDHPAWGIWSDQHLARAITQEAIVDRYFEWADEAAQRLGIGPDHPKPRRIRLFTGCGVGSAYRERAAEMLARLGINWIAGAPPAIIERYGLHDGTLLYNTTDPEGSARGMNAEQRMKVEKIKIGDEIHTYSSPDGINANPVRLAAFHDYLRRQVAIEQSDAVSFFGVADLSELTCLGSLPDNPGRFERRLFYHSQRFAHLVTADGFSNLTHRFETRFPNAMIYNNYSPHPVFLTGSTMNHVDWFVLCRNQAQSLGWGSDWATGGSWGLGTAYQCVSFYAALVECAVRKHGQPSGFYVGVNCGGGARKIFSCVARGLTVLELYSWGPIDAWAEGSNAWSEHRSQYYAVMAAAHALGPADTIIAEGRREPRRVALLYNRSHEIIQHGAGRLNHDWMWTYLGLAAAQVPVDVILEADLNAEDLARYQVLYLGGFNLEARHLEAIRAWVEDGGLLIGSGGAARLDVYNDPLPATTALFGAEQRPAGARDTASRARVQVAVSELYPTAMDLNPRGVLHILTPVGSGQSIATYDGGECAAVINTHGKGRTLLLGFHPGFTYRHNGTTQGTGLPWLKAPVRATLGRPRAELDYAGAEVTLFEHDSGIAVMLAAFGPAAPEAGCLLSVQTDREITTVRSALRGPLDWTRTGDRIETRTPRLDPVDVIILE